jgi:hypothetical protein
LLSSEASELVVVSRLWTPKLLRFMHSRDLVWLRIGRFVEDSSVFSSVRK